MSWFSVIFVLISLLSTDGKPTDSCAPNIIGPKISKCLFTLQDMTEMSKHAKDFDDEQKEKYLDDCDFFLSCRPAFECANDSNIDVAFRAMEVQCKSAKFIIKDFGECDQKLGALNSTCSQTYNPFKEINEKDIPTFLKNGRSEGCDKLFGDDDCMMKEIIEVCGKEQFEKFRKVQMELAQALRLCQFNKSME